MNRLQIYHLIIQRFNAQGQFINTSNESGKNVVFVASPSEIVSGFSSGLDSISSSNDDDLLPVGVWHLLKGISLLLLTEAKTGHRPTRHQREEVIVKTKKNQLTFYLEKDGLGSFCLLQSIFLETYLNPRHCNVGNEILK